jgi:hypothetical protein
MYARSDDDESKALKELRRIDHLLYVTLKYTRTVDVIRTIISKYLNTLNYRIEDHYVHLFEAGKIKEVPKAPLFRIKNLETLYKKDKIVKDLVDFYMMLRETFTAEYRSKEEYRKNVALVTKEREVNIAILKEYVIVVKEFVEHVDTLEK